MKAKALKVTHVIGLDTSTTCVGYAVFKLSAKNRTLVKYGKIVVPKELGYLQKCEHIISKIENVISAVEVSSAVVVIEQPNSFRNGETTRMLSGLYQIVRYMLYIRFGLEAIEANTKSVKKTVCGNGNAKKPEVVETINKLFGLKLKFHKSNKDKTDDDTSDAIAVAEFYIRTTQNEPRTSSRVRARKRNV